MFSWSSLQALAFLTCSSPGEAIPGQRRRQDPGHASRSPHGGSETRRVKKGRSAGWREPPPPSDVDRDKPGAGGSVALPGAGSLRFGSAALSFFRSPWSAWVTLFFYFWKIGLTQHRKKVIKRSRSFSIT